MKTRNLVSPESYQPAKYPPPQKKTQLALLNLFSYSVPQGIYFSFPSTLYGALNDTKKYTYFHRHRAMWFLKGGGE